MNDIKIKDPLKIIKRIWSYLKYEKIKFIQVLLLTIVITLISVITPLLISNIIDQYNINDINKLLTILIVLLILFILKSLSNYFTSIKMTEISENTLYKIRKELFDKTMNLEISYFEKNAKGDIMSKFTNDISTLNDALSEAVVSVISSVIIIIGVTIIMFYVNYVLAITTILTIPIFFFIVIKIGMKTNDYFMKAQNQIGNISSLSEDLLSGIKVTKSFLNENKTIEKFNKYSDELRDVQIKADLYSSLIMPANILIANLGNILIILIGSFLTIKGNLSIGSILAFITYAAMFRSPINNLASLVTELGSALSGATRIFNMIDEKTSIETNKKTIDKIKSIEFKNLNFGYDDKLILKNLSFKINEGDVIALVGPTGAGKTTLINLISKFYFVNDNQLFINDIDINEISKENLRKKIGIVLQDNYLFKETVLNNIKYGNEEATTKEIIEASKQAYAHDFIHRLPNDYSSMVEEDGINFSEGEKQLISIARVILNNPDFLILDEATSNVDSRTELLIQEGMKELMKNKTCLIIAHRLSTIKKADKIIYLENGEILEVGTHEALMNKKNKYYHLYMSQFK
ncbi:MAG: ABC transporter ATP-binding protein [Bacilli bacterium]|nr:ABC transporter ATP-binding protein [Bacilli bacterium]